MSYSSLPVLCHICYAYISYGTYVDMDKASVTVLTDERLRQVVVTQSLLPTNITT